ncbi:MAG TPA: WHG domain-containing protein [Thermomicrobiaceae bacterium]|nr:WHG domain-containing protein [Thermomicrobiaceae bacterium]
MGLNRELVVRAAAELLDAAGGREVPLAEVAARLGVRTPSLYNHIGGQEELRRELSLLGLRELGARLGRAAIGKSGHEALLAIGHAYRAFARERPGLYLATLRASAPDDAAHQAASREILDVLHLVLAPYGLDPEEEVHAIRGLRSLAHGFVSLELAGAFGLPVDPDASYYRLLAMYIQGLGQTSTSRYPSNSR